LGNAAFEGGIATALLGVFFHLIISLYHRWCFHYERRPNSSLAPLCHRWRAPVWSARWLAKPEEVIGMDRIGVKMRVRPRAAGKIADHIHDWSSF
jgi:hypothetical protein